MSACVSFAECLRSCIARWSALVSRLSMLSSRVAMSASVGSLSVAIRLPFYCGYRYSSMKNPSRQHYPPAQSASPPKNSAKNISENDLTNTIKHAIVIYMNMRRLPSLPAGVGLMAPSLAPVQQTATPGHNLRRGADCSLGGQSRSFPCAASLLGFLAQSVGVLFRGRVCSFVAGCVWRQGRESLSLARRSDGDMSVCLSWHLEVL